MGRKLGSWSIGEESGIPSVAVKCVEIRKDVYKRQMLEIPPKYSISGFMGFLKGKSSLMIYEKWGNMKYKYRKMCIRDRIKATLGITG